jgi:hypothetical protein
VPELGNLRTKLPAELFDEGSIFERSSEELEELKKEVEELLIAKLVLHGGNI